jgi:hypothetical protein
MQGAWYRCGRKCQYVNLGAEFFQLFLVFDTETLFFVNNQQAEVFDFNILRQ